MLVLLLVLLNFPKGAPTVLFCRCAGLFRALSGATRSGFWALRAAFGGRAGSRLAVYRGFCTSCWMRCLPCWGGVWRCFEQVGSVREGSSLMGGVSDGKVVEGVGGEWGWGRGFLPVPGGLGALLGCWPFRAFLLGLSRGGFFACLCLVGLGVCFGRWPFLAFTVVYWCCPCAGRHSLSLPPQRK
ncbi:hypothetical protein LMG28140_06099 [Paraburkholderia metrosideri]|uniref:Secreted protein n=1 Tax=Paraburkholderia metrosideri TaxID=580937 RepID=A0ABM8P604_9BURK|nr:hypothetical protein LMG28140_06099 [Paraburkholderia metrosideri]